MRIATQRDLITLEAIENAADWLLFDLFGAPRWDAAPSGEIRAQLPGFVLVVDDSNDEKVVGFAHTLEVDGFAHLEQISVLPGHGRQGIGRSLVGAAKAEAQRRGYPQLTLRTYVDVPWNAPFYATCGFIESQPRSAFHHHLVQTEEILGLERYGRRIQMTAPLSGTFPAEALLQ